MDLVVEGTKDEVTVRIVGEVLADSCPDLREAVMNVAARHPKRILLDLSAMPFIDTSGLGTLVGLRSHMKKAGIAFILRNPTHRVSDILTITHLHRLFDLP